MEGFEMHRANEEDPRVVGCRLSSLRVVILSSCVYLMFTLCEEVLAVIFWLLGSLISCLL